MACREIWPQSLQLTKEGWRDVRGHVIILSSRKNMSGARIHEQKSLVSRQSPNIPRRWEQPDHAINIPGHFITFRVFKAVKLVFIHREIFRVFHCTSSWWMTTHCVGTFFAHFKFPSCSQNVLGQIRKPDSNISNEIQVSLARKLEVRKFPNLLDNISLALFQNYRKCWKSMIRRMNYRFSTLAVNIGTQLLTWLYSHQ